MGTREHASSAGVIKEAYSQIGKHVGSTDGDIRGSRRRLENLVTTATIQNDISSKRSESLAIRLITAASQDQVHGVYLRRHFDGTPLFLRFGQLEHALQDCCRYLVPYNHSDESTGIEYTRWKTVSRDELDALGAEATVAKRLSRVGGVVEVFGQHSTLFSVSAKSDVTGSPLWDTYREATQPLLIEPKIIKRNTASCAFAALFKGTVGARLE